MLKVKTVVETIGWIPSNTN